MKLARTFAASALTAVALFGLAACGQPGGNDATDGNAAAEVNPDAPLYGELPKRITDAGKIVNAGDLTFAPFESLENNGKTVVGIDVDIAEALSAQLGVPFDWQDVKTEAALSGIQSERYDTLLSSMTYTDERAKTYDYVTYLKASSIFLTAPDRVGEFTKAEDFCGTKVAGARGTIQVTLVEELSAKCVTDGHKKIDVQALDTDQAGVLQIRQGGVDASIINGAVGMYAVQQSPDDIAVVPDVALSDSVYGIMMRKDDAELRDTLLAAMNNIIADGSYAKILDKWGVSELAITEAQINNGN